MSLTLGSGPISTQPGGAFNFEIEAPKHRIYFEPYPRRMRALVGGHTVLDTTEAKLLYESNIPPRLYVPVDALDRDVLVESDHTTHCPFKGDASYWTIEVGDRRVENGVWYYPDPIESAPWLADYASVYPHAADLWLEEDEQLRVQLRDPYHRVEVLESSRTVKVVANGVTVAESDRPKLLFETGVEPRVYLLRSDILPDVLERGETTSDCPYKGHATHWNLRAGDATIEDAAWSYESPLPEALRVAGHFSFDGEGIEVELS